MTRTAEEITPATARLRPLSRALLRDEDYRLMVEAVPDYAIFFLDADGYVRSWNQARGTNQGLRGGRDHRQPLLDVLSAGTASSADGRSTN